MATADTRLMIEETLAQTYTRMDGRTGSTKMVTVDVGDLPPSENPGLWCHTIAIRRGMIYDPYHPRGISALHLYLNGNNIGACPADRNYPGTKGTPYMCHIRKVWELAQLED